MAVTWTISTLERNSSDDGVIVAHWRASDVDGDHSGSSYGTCSFTPDVDAEGFTPYADITEAQAIGWVKDDMGEEAVTALEDSIAAQIAESKAPAVAVGTPW
jgi:cytochrome c1